MFKMVLDLVFYVSIVKHQLYDCKNWETEITAVPTESLKTMVIVGQTQPEILALSEEVLIDNIIQKYP